MPDFLLEIGCEEIPARMIDAAALDLRERVHKLLERERLAASKDIKIYDPDTGNVLATLTNHGAPVTALAYTPDGKVLASGSLDATVRIWDPAAGKQLSTQALAPAFQARGLRHQLDHGPHVRHEVPSRQLVAHAGPPAARDARSSHTAP